MAIVQIGLKILTSAGGFMEPIEKKRESAGAPILSNLKLDLPLSSRLKVYRLFFFINLFHYYSNSLLIVQSRFALCIITTTLFNSFRLLRFFPWLNGKFRFQPKKSFIELPLNKQKCISFNLIQQLGCTLCNISCSFNPFAPFFRRLDTKSAYHLTYQLQLFCQNFFSSVFYYVCVWLLFPTVQLRFSKTVIDYYQINNFRLKPKSR